MKAKELHGNDNRRADEQMTELKAELFNLRFQLATGQLQNPWR